MTDTSTSTDAPTIAQRIAAAHPHYENASDGTLENHSISDVSFFNRFKLNQGTLHAHDHQLPIKFLDDGKELFVLDGTPSALNEAANRENLRLSEAQVKAFVLFYFEHVGAGELTIVESVEEAKSVPSEKPLSWTEDPKLHELIQPFKSASSDGQFIVSFNGVWETLLVAMTMQLASNGTLIPQSQQMLRS